MTKKCRVVAQTNAKMTAANVMIDASRAPTSGIHPRIAIIGEKSNVCPITLKNQEPYLNMDDVDSFSLMISLKAASTPC